MSKVSIIIPAYNVEKYIERTIYSCTMQTYSDLEIIVVNDGSTDNTLSIINNKKTEDQRIIVVDKKNEGVTSARIKGLSNATGTYIFFLDGDDYITDNAIETLVRVAEQNNADFVIGNIIIEFENSSESYEKEYPSFDVIDNLSFLRYCFENTYFYITGCLIRRDVFLNTKLEIPYDITYGEDNLAIVQLGYHIKRASNSGKSILHYVQRSDSVTHSKSILKIEKRAKACMLTVDHTKQQGFYIALSTSINYFMSKEQVGFILSGYWNKQLSQYRTPSILFHLEAIRRLGLKNVLILISLTISPNFSIRLCNFARKLKKIIQ